MLREDGTGAIEYFYGKMGEVTKTRRTVIVPNQAIATYVTQWTYDSHNRLLEMIYPDEEKVTYTYDLGGQLTNVHGYKSYGYDYVDGEGFCCDDGSMEAARTRAMAKALEDNFQEDEKASPEKCLLPQYDLPGSVY